MSTQHPITPPPELVRDWARFQNHEDPEALWLRIATLAARWGADQELDACLRHLDAKGHHPTVLDALRNDRRPKPPSLKEEALAALEQVEADFNTGSFGDTIRRALEALPND
jgi:hypothetical protein